MRHPSSLVRSALLVAICLFGLTGSAGYASAFSVSPVLFDYTLDPGATVQGALHVVNDTNQEQTYNVEIQNFVPQDEEGRQSFLPENDKSGLASWIALDQPSVTLQAGEAKEFTWAVKIPKDAEPGGHYSAVFFSTAPVGENGSSVGVGAKTGVLFLVNVNGNVKEDASVESFKVLGRDNVPFSGTPWLNRLPTNFEVRIRNNGSVHLTPTGKVAVKNMFGNTVDMIPFNSAQSKVLPNSVRKVYAAWGPSLEEGSGFWSGLKAEWEGFALGRYTATLDGMYGKQNQKLSSDVTFWILPWRVMIMAFGGLILIFLVLKLYNRMVIRSAMSKISKKS